MRVPNRETILLLTHRYLIDDGSSRPRGTESGPPTLGEKLRSLFEEYQAAYLL